MEFPELHLGPKIMCRKEKVEISHPATGPKMTRIGIACVPVGIDEIFLLILNDHGLSDPVYGGCAKMCMDFELEGCKA